jgi:hypothetical protein
MPASILAFAGSVSFNFNLLFCALREPQCLLVVRWSLTGVLSWRPDDGNAPLLVERLAPPRHDALQRLDRVINVVFMHAPLLRVEVEHVVDTLA